MSLLKFKKPGVDLQDYYIINLEAGLILTLTTLIIMFRINIDFKSEFTITEVEQDIIEMEEIVRTEQILRPPPPPRPPAPVVVPDAEIVDDVFFDLDTEFDSGGMLSLLPPPPPMPEDSLDQDFDEDEIFTIVEDMPVLIGGTSSIYDYLRYPDLAVMAGIEGRVIVQFVIDEQGDVNDPVVIRGIGGGCDEAAIEAAKKLKFIPGRQRGRAVKVRYSLPIVFRLAT